MCPFESKATRLPEGEIAAFPPASSTGSAVASNATVPSAALNTRTRWAFTSLRSSAQEVPISRVTASDSRRKRSPVSERLRIGQTEYPEVESCQSNCPLVAMPISPKPPSGLHVVASSSPLETKSSRGMHWDITWATRLLPPVNWFRLIDQWLLYPLSASRSPWLSREILVTAWTRVTFRTSP